MRNKKHAVEWCLPNMKRPFAYSTIAESESIAILFEDNGRDLRKVLESDPILSDNERFIIESFINKGIYSPAIR